MLPSTYTPLNLRGELLMLRRLTIPLASMLLSLASGSAAAKPHPRAPAGASGALESAKRDWQQLKSDAKRSKYRSHWLKVAGEFAQVAKRYPKSPEAAKALFDAGELYDDLSRISWIQDDVDAAAQAYARITKSYPQSNLADDAHLALARIYLNRKNDAERARSELKSLLKNNPKGDMVPQARTMLAQLPAEEKPSAPEPKQAEPAKLAKKSAAPEPKAAPAAAAPSTRVVDAEWADAAPAAAKPPPIVDNSAVDGARGDDDEDEQAEAPSEPKRAPEPIAVGKKVAADKDRLAALATAVKDSDELPLSAQMGLKVRRVVIDAGHGGHDTGAIGPTGVQEKDVSLAVAKRLAEKLKGQGLEVRLTRSEDRFVSLENRASFANDQHADLFISVHCNAATERSLHGMETYSLNVSSDRYAMRLAARENASSERSISDLQFLLADLATRANTADSRRLAHLVQHSLVNGLRTRYTPVRDLGTKEALFYVLLGTRMPAILVETSFISNPVEEKRLTDAEYQDQLATSIASGVERFVGDRQALATAGLP